MSSSFRPVEVLTLFGSARRQLNLMATSALRPLGIGPKQAIILREIKTRRSASLTELSKATHTDPASTGKIIESLIKKRWVRRSDDPADRRRWMVSLTAEGSSGSKKLDSIIRGLAHDFCGSLSVRDLDTLFRILGLISNHLEQTLASLPEEKSL